MGMIDDRLSWALGLSGRAAGGLVAKVCVDRGLKPAHVHILTLLNRHGALSQQRLIEEIGVDPSVLVTLLNDLEAEDLALRRRDPADRRRHIVELTEHGSEVLAEIDHTVAAAEHELFADLNADDRCTLHRLLDRIRLRSGCTEADDESC